MSLFKPEVIGDPRCPLIHRWTFLGERLTRNWPVKVMLHHFLPESSDRDAHDHPRPFVTIVLKGHYHDLKVVLDDSTATGLKVANVDRVAAPGIRYRSATHTHQTITGAKGCWTIVIMGPKIRDWGFLLKNNGWMPFSQYRKIHKHGMRCD